MKSYEFRIRFSKFHICIFNFLSKNKKKSKSLNDSKKLQSNKKKSTNKRNMKNEYVT